LTAPDGVHLAQLEARIRANVALTARAFIVPIDQPEASPWQRIGSVEDLIESERTRLHTWRDETLGTLRHRLIEDTVGLAPTPAPFPTPESGRAH
jgi:hypothetical protein